MRACVCVCVRACARACVCVCVCVCACVCVAVQNNYPLSLSFCHSVSLPPSLLLPHTHTHTHTHTHHTVPTWRIFAKRHTPNTMKSFVAGDSKRWDLLTLEPTTNQSGRYSVAKQESVGTNTATDWQCSYVYVL